MERQWGIDRVLSKIWKYDGKEIEKWKMSM